MMKEPLKILLIDDDEDDLFITQRLLNQASGVQAGIDWAKGYEEGLNAVTSYPYDIALVDYRLGLQNGLDLLREAVEQGCRTPFILLTGQGDREVDLRAMAAGAADYLVKWEFDAQLLERSIRYARERKRAEERIREQAALLDKARDAICAYDLYNRVIYWNKSAERLTGWTAEEMMGRVVDEWLFDPNEPTLKTAHEAVREGGEWSGELHQKTKKGGVIIVESRWTLVRDSAGQPRSILVINTDVTEHKLLESQMLRAQRMESIGRLVSGIAHDLGNLLVPILLGVKVMQQRYADDEKAQRTLAMIQQSGQRGAEMVKQVLAFARGVQGERVPLHLKHVIREVEELTREAFPPTVDVKTYIPDDLWVVHGDATQLQQVLVNLCVNARDAMPRGGQLTIQAENLIADTQLAKRHLEAKPGAYVKVSITDTGVGISPDVLDKVFEPFFTTKPAGKGTGLGLSTVYSIVKSHGGFVGVESDVGAGTSFYIFLPVTVKDAAIHPEGLPSHVREGEGELILVVDDEPFILDTAQETLERAGYRVLSAPNGEKALALFAKHEDEIAAVVTDLVMPEMGGVETIRFLRQQQSNLPIIATSGMADSRTQEALAAGASLFLAKPFTAEMLYAALDELLAEEPTG
ncbi:MAG: response regulator [Rhodothermales bacterium]